MCGARDREGDRDRAIKSSFSIFAADSPFLSNITLNQSSNDDLKIPPSESGLVPNSFLVC